MEESKKIPPVERLGVRFNQRLENRQTFFNHFGRHAVADAEILLAPKVRSRNDQKVFLLCFFRKGLTVAAGGLDEQIKCAVGLGHFVAIGGKSIIQHAPVAVVGIQVRAELGAPGDDLLEQTGCAHMAGNPGAAGDSGVEGLAVGGVLRHIDIANSFAGEG